MGLGFQRETIIKLLKRHPEGLTISSIADHCGIHRHTATKYVYELRGADLITERDIGPAKLIYLKNGLSERERLKVFDRLNGKRLKSTLGQVQIFALVAFLLLVPTTIILAQNATNLSLENLSIPLEGYLIASNEGITNHYKNNTSVFSNLSQEEIDGILGTNQTTNESDFIIPVLNMTVNGTNGSDGNHTVPSNESQNITLPGNMTLPRNQTNQTFGNETNATVPVNGTNSTVDIPVINETNETWEEPLPGDNVNISVPSLSLEIISPENITRGEAFEAKAKVSNQGPRNASNVRIRWILPEGFEIISGEQEKVHEILEEGMDCWNNIRVITTDFAPIGDEKMRVEVRYR